MGAQTAPSRGTIISGINVTPLVDITLVLLIIFIVTAKIVVTPGVTLDLPEASSAEDVQVVFSVLVQADGATTVNGAVVASYDALRERARQAARDDPELRAVIQADGAVPHRRVMAVVDALKRGGVSRLAFGALPEDEAP